MAPDLVILGGGSWGTALAIHLARAGRRVSWWIHDPALAARVRETRLNATYLPGHRIPDDVRVTNELGEALHEAVNVLLVVPSHHCRGVLAACREHVRQPIHLCSASKGIESDTLKTVCEVATEVLHGALEGPVTALSGPSFALEVAAGHPTAVVVGTPDPESGAHLQSLVSAGALRVYTNGDRVGVELGGALKNVVAIAAGVVEGLGYGSNTLAALITRGLAEMSRLAEALGGRRETLSGLAGLGDLVLTCTGRLSRNRSLGVALGTGRTLVEHQATTPMVSEGIRTTLSACLLARREGVEMPIAEQVHAVLYAGRPPGDAIRDLLARQLTSEGR